MSARSIFSVLLALAALAACAGCGSDSGTLTPETDEPLYRAGVQLEREGRNEEALSDYLRLIDRRGDQAPQSHLEAGILCLDTFKDPIAAIYHFRRYLKLQPNSPQAGYVLGQIDAAKREFASTLPAPAWIGSSAAAGAGNPGSPALSPDLMMRIDALQRENTTLRAELAELRANAAGGVALRAPEPVDARAAESPAQSGLSPVVLVPANAVAAVPDAGGAEARERERYHVVVPGENLMKIAREYYHRDARWREIVAANPAQFPDGKNTVLRPGMRLRIP
ncbi:MAG: Cell division protein CpoB [Opitutaceae bacterium]